METHVLILESKRTEILRFEQLLEAVNKVFCLEPERFVNLQIASSEAIVNAIVHGNKENPEKKVLTEISHNSTAIRVLIKDQGEGFDLDKLPDPTAEENLFKESGRGIYIIRSLVDEFECTSSSAGTVYILKMHKNKTP
ncbi:MAG: ATP-binding protein [Ignavibacteria bacterium]|nr:ATP-binding protein [Ignavibacteria bacterium]